MNRAFLIIGLCLLMGSRMQAQRYDIRMDRPQTRPIPAWFNEAKFGVFLVWGLYSAPAYSKGHYAEWYWKDMEHVDATRLFHAKTYGTDFKYEQFVDQFKPVFFDADQWCALFEASGARYVVTTANYHDGYTLYPTQYSLTENADKWNSVETGPQMDIIGALQKAGEAKGLKMGIYYSLYEWNHPIYLKDKKQFARQWFHPKFKEVVTQYKPWFIFLDGEWEQSYKDWDSEPLAAWLYNESVVKDYVVVNDRWGGGNRGVFGDVYSSEYGDGKHTSAHHPWQEDRGIGKSYGYNRYEQVTDYDTPTTLIRRLSSVVGGGGNFLLAIGPTADGRIPVIMQERLLQVGDWLKIYGSSIYGTKANPWWPRRFEWGTATQKDSFIYLHIHDSSMHQIQVRDFTGEVQSARLLSVQGAKPVSFKQVQNTLELQWDAHFNHDAVSIIELAVSGSVAGATLPEQQSNKHLDFNCWAMTINGTQARVAYSGDGANLKIVQWNDARETVSAKFTILFAGTYQLALSYQATSEAASGDFTVRMNDQVLKAKTRDGKGGFIKHEIGSLHFSKPGNYEIQIIPASNGSWKEMRLRDLHVIPPIQPK